MIINTKRHDFGSLRFQGRIVIAPRYFKFNNYIYLIHIMNGCYCERVQLWLYMFGKVYNNSNCIYRGSLKLYSSNKGLYFNWLYHSSDGKKKYTRVYLCD